MSSAVGLAIIGAAVGVVFLFRVQSLQVEVNRLNIETAAMSGGLTQLEKKQNQLAEEHKKDTDFPLTADRPSISENEVHIIREFIKVPPPSINGQPLWRLGDNLPRSISLPLPQPVLSQIPKLRGGRFAVDKNGSITITDENGDRVAVIITVDKQAVVKSQL